MPVTMVCFDELPVTETPSEHPTEGPTHEPTFAPTRACEMITISNVGKYNGQYRKGSTDVNDHFSWIARHNVMAGELVKLYYYQGILGDRWRLDGPNGSYFAPKEHFNALNTAGDSTFPPGIEAYWGANGANTEWEFVDTTGQSSQSTIVMGITCSAEIVPTAMPTRTPTELPSQFPTMAPTSLCESIEVTGTELGPAPECVDIPTFVQCDKARSYCAWSTESLTCGPRLDEKLQPYTVPTLGINYDGVYNRQQADIYNRPVWVSRNDVGGKNSDLKIKLFYYAGVHGNGWKLEGAERTYLATKTSTATDNRFPPGLVDHEHKFGSVVAWEVLGEVREAFIQIECRATRAPTFEPSSMPTERPTTSPTEQPTDACSALEIAGTTGLSENYDGVYIRKQDKKNGAYQYASRNDVGLTIVDNKYVNPNVQLFYSQSAYHRIEMEDPRIELLSTRPD